MALGSRPTPEELLDGAIRALRTGVLPSVDDHVVAERVGSVVAILGYLRQHWDTAVADLVAEIAALEELLADAAGALEATGDVEWAAELAALAATREPSLAHSALAARTDALHDALVALFALVDPDDAPAPLAALRPRVHAELAAVAGRRMAPPRA